MPHYKIEALRTIRSLQSAYEKGKRTAQAEQMRAVGDQVETMVKALEAIASLYWQDAPDRKRCERWPGRRFGVKDERAMRRNPLLREKGESKGESMGVANSYRKE